MNNLYQFERFDFERFWKGKVARVLAINPWYEYKDGEKTGNVIGSVLQCSIEVDNTVYKETKKGVAPNNLGEQVFFRVSNKDSFAGVSVGSQIGYEKGMFSPVIKSCSAYPSRQGSNYKDKLSIEVIKFDKC